MIKALAICDKGIERVVQIELAELIKVKTNVKINERAVLFSPKSYDDLLKFCYLTQSSERILLLFDKVMFKDYDDLLNNLIKSLKKNKSVLKHWFKKDTKFKVECKRIGKHDFGSHMIEKEFGSEVFDTLEKIFSVEPKVDLDSPELIMHVFINNAQAYYGIDLIGKDVSKRQYRIFAHAADINSCIAFSISKLAGYSKNKALLDPFCKAGSICIEAALGVNKISINKYSKEFSFKKLIMFKNKDWDDFFRKIDSKAASTKLSIKGYDYLLKNIVSARKNAKLAGVDKLLEFSKTELEWLDTKLNKGEIDVIASKIPCVSKHNSEKIIKKIYKEFLYQAEFVLKKKAMIGVLTEHTDLLKQMIKEMKRQLFKVVEESEIWAGQQRYEFVLIEKE